MIFFVNPHEQFVHSKWHRLFKRVDKINHNYYLMLNLWLMFRMQIQISTMSVCFNRISGWIAEKKKRKKKIFWDTYTKPNWARCRPIFVLRLNHTHVMLEAWNRKISRIVTIVSCHQHSCVGINAEEVGCAANPFDFFLGKCWQSWTRKSLLFAVCFDAIDHNLWIIAVFRENRMRKPANLQLILFDQ